MKKIEFEKQIERLIENYGQRGVPAQRVALIWNEYGHANLDDFRLAIDTIILSCRYAPMLEDFRNNFSGASKGRRQTRIDEILKNHNCTLCDNTGSILVNNKAQRCSCELGEAGLCLPAYVKRSNERRYTKPVLAQGVSLAKIRGMVDSFEVRKI